MLHRLLHERTLFNIQAGIICASFMDISLNPSPVMLLALISTIITLIYYHYQNSVELKVSKIQSESSFLVFALYFNRSFFRIVLPLIGTIVNCVVISTRRSTKHPLLNTNTYGENIYAKTAGLQFASYFVTLGTAAVTGIICGLVANFFMGMKSKEKSLQLLPT